MQTPLLDDFNSFASVIRWSTPSIHPDVPQVRDIYANDMGTGYHKIGSALTNTGIFGEATALAAEAYQADHTLFCVQGSTTTNFMILRALKYQLGTVTMLGGRNAHMSIITACHDYGINFIPIEPRFDQDLQLFIPNTVEEIMTGVRAHRPNVLFLSNPTYEGNSVDLLAVISAVRAHDPNIIIFIDESWGAHFSFSPKLPASAMQAGADICTQSTHKQGGALTQSSMLHWKGSRIDSAEVYRAYRALCTTSPSYHMLAALDGTRAFMQARGEEAIDNAIQVADYFVEQLQAIPEIETHVASDPTKLLLHIPDYDVPAMVALLEDDGIVVEKYDVHNLTIVVGFQSTRQHVDTTVTSLQKILRSLPPAATTVPVFPTRVERKEHANGEPQMVLLHEAVGRTCDEYITPYPPGIPLLVPGEVIREEHIEYIKAVQAAGKLMTLFMSEPMYIRTK